MNKWLWFEASLSHAKTHNYINKCEENITMVPQLSVVIATWGWDTKMVPHTHTPSLHHIFFPNLLDSTAKGMDSIYNLMVFVG